MDSGNPNRHCAGHEYREDQCLERNHLVFVPAKLGWHLPASEALEVVSRSIRICSSRWVRSTPAGDTPQRPKAHPCPSIQPRCSARASARPFLSILHKACSLREDVARSGSPCKTEPPGQRGGQSLPLPVRGLCEPVSREKQARIILGQAEVEIAHLFDQAAQSYKENPTALHLRAMNMLYEGLKEKGALMLVPSTAVESMGMGGLLGAAAYRQQALTEPSEKSKSE